MAYEKKDMTGALFDNKRKTQEKHPDKNGWLKVGGREIWVSGWINEGNGEPFISLRLQFRDEAEAKRAKAPSGEAAPRPQPTTQPPADAGFEDDDIPF